MVEGLIEFGPTLRRLRETQGIGLRQFALKVHYSPGYVSKMERSLAPPTVDFVEACDRVLKLHPRLIETTLTAARQAARSQLMRPAQLPTAVGDFVGRADILDILDRVLTALAPAGSVPIAVLEGAPGIGKTSIALQWAHANAARYPDGALFANLRGGGDRGVRLHPRDILKDWLRSLGVPAERIPPETESRSTLLRSLLADKRMLLVLDNAAGAHQVLPLLPSSPGCAVVVTTRMNLTDLLAYTSASRVTLSGLPLEHGLELLRGVIGEGRGAAEPGSEMSVETVAAPAGQPLDTTRDLVDQLAAGHPLENTGPGGDRFQAQQRAYAAETNPHSASLKEMPQREGVSLKTKHPWQYRKHLKTSHTASSG